MRIELEHLAAATAAERWVQRRNAWEAPRLPMLREDTVRRWAAGPTWTAPGTKQLVRHRSEDGQRCLISTDRRAPKGFTIEYDLGLVHEHAQPGTARLMASREGYFTTLFEGEPGEGYRGLGYVEQAPLPMLDVLELRLDPVAGEPILVAGPSDPLYESAKPLAVLGFVESYPINPRTVPVLKLDWGIATLARTVDAARWRHRYAVRAPHGRGGVALGGVWANPGPDFVELERDASGLLRTELLGEPRRQASIATMLRWSVAPLSWSQGRPRGWALRASAGRLRRLAIDGQGASREPRAHEDSSWPAAYLRKSPSEGWSPVFSALHPALEDQYVTRSEIEATDMGYLVEGILGYVLDGFADRSLEAAPAEVKWGSRFGQHRRYVEGRAPS
jgi:hypothetical protein